MCVEGKTSRLIWLVCNSVIITVLKYNTNGQHAIRNNYWSSTVSKFKYKELSNIEFWKCAPEEDFTALKLVCRFDSICKWKKFFSDGFYQK